QGQQGFTLQGQEGIIPPGHSRTVQPALPQDHHFSNNFDVSQIIRDLTSSKRTVLEANLITGSGLLYRGTAHSTIKPATKVQEVNRQGLLDDSVEQEKLHINDQQDIKLDDSFFITGDILDSK
ncbi:hypothetical protein OTU49_002696, partial [Cherax quadricarinatus]